MSHGLLPRHGAAATSKASDLTAVAWPFQEHLAGREDLLAAQQTAAFTKPLMTYMYTRALSNLYRLIFDF